MKRILISMLVIIALILTSFFLMGDLEQTFSNILTDLRRQPGRFATMSFLILSSDIVLPVPSTLVMYVNGYVLGIAAGASVSFMAVMVSSMLGYGLGAFGAARFFKQPDEKAEAILKKYGASAILISRGIPVLSESVSLLCGLQRVRFGEFVVLNLIGYAPLCLLYAIFGQLGLDQNAFILSLLFSLILAASFWYWSKSLLHFGQHK